MRNVIILYFFTEQNEKRSRNSYIIITSSAYSSIFFALSQILIITFYYYYCAKIDVISPNLIRKNTSRCYDGLLRPIGLVFGASPHPPFFALNKYLIIITYRY